MDSLKLRAIMVFLNYFQKGIEIDLLHCELRIKERVPDEHMQEIINAFKEASDWARINHPKGDWFRSSKPTGYKVVGTGHVIRTVLTKDMAFKKVNY